MHMCIYEFVSLSLCVNTKQCCIQASNVMYVLGVHLRRLEAVAPLFFTSNERRKKNDRKYFIPNAKSFTFARRQRKWKKLKANLLLENFGFDNEKPAHGKKFVKSNMKFKKFNEMQLRKFYQEIYNIIIKMIKLIRYDNILVSIYFLAN